MKKKSAFLLPKTADDIPNGGVYLQRVRCGKKTCRCVRLGETHRAFYFLIRVDGKQRKKYVAQDDVAALGLLVEASRRSRSEFRADRRSAIQAYRAIREFIDSVNN